MYEVNTEIAEILTAQVKPFSVDLQCLEVSVMPQSEDSIAIGNTEKDKNLSPGSEF